MPRSSPMAALPYPIKDRVRNRRGRGWGPDRIYKELRHELAPHGVTVAALRNWIYSRADAPDSTSTDQVQANLGKVADLLTRSGIDAADVGKVKQIKLSTWEGLTKNEAGEPEVTELEGAAVVLSPEWAEGPKWEPVSRGPAVKLPAPRKPKVNATGWETAVVVPDVQIGFRRDPETGALDPFHDETAMAAALAVVQAIDPDLVVLLGDLVDLAQFGRFEQEAAFALTTQPALDRATLFLAQIRVAAPHARIVVIEGNHDRRLQKSITNNALAAFALRPGFTPPDTWPDLSVPHLLRFDDLDVEYIAGYPAGLFWINQNLACIHGHRVNSAGSTAARVVDDSRVSVLFGHTHRVELMHRTRLAYEGAKHCLAASPGCLCRIDGTVPSTKSSTDVFGRPVPTVENWSQGVAVVAYQPGDGRYSLELIPIFDGDVVLRGAPLTVE